MKVIRKLQGKWNNKRSKIGTENFGRSYYKSTYVYRNISYCISNLNRLYVKCRLLASDDARQCSDSSVLRENINESTYRIQIKMDHIRVK